MPRDTAPPNARPPAPPCARKANTASLGDLGPVTDSVAATNAKEKFKLRTLTLVSRLGNDEVGERLCNKKAAGNQPCTQKGHRRASSWDELPPATRTSDDGIRPRAALQVAQAANPAAEETLYV